MQSSHLARRVVSTFAAALIISIVGVAIAHAEATVLDAFGLDAGSVVSLEVDGTPGVPVSVVVPFDGVDYTLDLVPHSVRADEFSFVVHEGGASVEVNPGPGRTVRGSIRGAQTSLVVGSVLRAGLTARIEMPDGEVIWVEPLTSRLAEADPSLHVVYRAGDVRSHDVSCGVVEDSLPESVERGFHSGTGSSDGESRIAELATDADYEFFLTWGPDEQDVRDRVELLVNLVNVQYTRDVGVEHAITAIFVRTEPVYSCDEDLLAQFQERWLTQEPERSVRRDLAHLFTGCDAADGGARIGVVCTDDAFAFSRPDVIENIECGTDLIAHMLGHLWGAGHCSCQDPPYTMNPLLTCANQFHPDTIETIINFRNSRACLDDALEICIVHGNPDWEREDPSTHTSWYNWAFSGYIDPKQESSNGVDLDMGIGPVDDDPNHSYPYSVPITSVVFTVEPFGDPDGGPVTPDNVSVEETGGAPPPNVVGVTKDGNALSVELDRIITLQEWTTVVFDVWDADGVRIVDNGNEGEDVNECARLDLGFLPGDLNGSGSTQPLDMSRWIAAWRAGPPIPLPSDVGPGNSEDYLDINRNGLIQPQDFAHLVALMKGVPPSTRNWRGEGMNNTRP